MSSSSPSSVSAAFQFTPLREGRPVAVPAAHLQRHISIHAPPRGATSKQAGVEPDCCYFNSRPSARGDCLLCGALWTGSISIHAPPRGATLSIKRTLAPLAFQFTPLREGRPRGSASRLRRTNFNSRPSARGDRRRISHRRAVRNFNSRPSARGDRWRTLPAAGRRRISIHAPPRGATAARARARRRRHYFNSRPSARGDVPGKE